MVNILESSKIKSIFIELKDFGFFHAPSSINNENYRIFGRTEQKQKLKKLLTNYNSNSGTYLITGFRGIGKTSLVNEVLRDISGKAYYISYLRYFRVVVFLILYVLFLSGKEFWNIFNIILLGLFIYQLFLSISNKIKLRNNILACLKSFILTVDSPSENVLKRLNPNYAIGFSNA